MKKIWISLFLAAAALLLTSACATVATCPGNLLPLVEIQVANTASNFDDYGSTQSYTACRARITNATGFNNVVNFPGGVAVELRNPQAGTSNLLFSPAASGGASSLMATLPGTGGWLSFYVKGTATSSVDKSSIIEMATAGATCNEVVIARKAMMIPSGAPPIAASSPQVEMEIGGTSTLDDYLTWSPMASRIRWANAPMASSTLSVTLQNPDGRLGFAPSTLAAATPVSAPPLPLTLPGDGSWVSFYVGGRFPNASLADKDAILEVRDSSNTLLSREGLMVRIRKNANTLTTAERDRYLQALSKLDITYAEYIFFVRTHSRSSTGSGGSQVAHQQAHGCSGFLPWHRAFVLDFERKLQAADPSVALHYWKFDVGAPNIFTSGFMGMNDPSGAAQAVLSATNPIIGWLLSGEGFAAGTLQRHTPYGDSGHPSVATEMATLALGSNFSAFKAMESNPHNPAHSTSGSGLSWIAGSPAIATRDPLFFFLHCNVDHLWAKWQLVNNRYNPTTAAAYDFQGSFSSPGAGVPTPAAPCPTLGQYVNDTIWPWDNVLNGTGAAQRPDIAILTPFPIAVGYLPISGKPTIALMIDYTGKTAGGPSSGMGFAYDDVQY